MLKYKQIWHGIKPIRWLNKFNLTKDDFCHSYWKLPLQGDALWLKKRKATYQRMMMRIFEPQLSKSIEVYIDNTMVKSKVVSEHVGNLKNIFEILRKHKLRLNASKCSFGMGSGKFLGYMVTHRG